MKFREESGRCYQLNDQGQLMAEVLFPGEDVLSINCTFVHDDLRGQGIAKELVLVVIDKARAENKKIKPVCSYAVKFFDQNKEQYEDVLE